MKRWREWRLHRARLQLADLEEDYEKWSWSYKPSERDLLDRRIVRAKRRVSQLAEQEGTKR